MLIYFGCFPFRFGRMAGEAPWKILDAKTDVVAEGKSTVEKVLVPAEVPSACEKVEGLLAGGKA